MAGLADHISCKHQAVPCGSRRRGAVLMEVVVALALFFIAGIFVMDGLNSSIRGLQTIKLEAEASDLAVTTFSEVQMGLTEMVSVGPVGVAHEGSEGWTYELVVSGVEDLPDMPQLKKVDVIIRNDANAFTYKTTHLVWENPNPLPAVPGVDQIPSDLAGAIPGGNSAGALSGGNLPGGNFPNATPQFPGRGNTGGTGGDATPQFPGRGNTGGNGGNATPQFPGRGNNNGGNATPQFPGRGNNNAPNATPQFPGRGNNNAPNATPQFPGRGNNNAPNATPQFPGRGNNNAPNATPQFPGRGNNNGGNGNNNTPRQPAPPANNGQNEEEQGGAP